MLLILKLNKSRSFIFKKDIGNLTNTLDIAQSHNQPKKHDKKEEGCTTKLEKGINNTVFLKKGAVRNPLPTMISAKDFQNKKG